MVTDAEYLEHAARNMAAVWQHIAAACDGRIERWDDAVAVDSGAPNPVMNRTTITSPAVRADDLAKRVHDFYSAGEVPYGAVDPWENVDLSELGFTLIYRMPLMVLDEPQLVVANEQLRIERVTNQDGLRAFKTVLFEGFDLVPWPASTDSLFDHRVYDNPDCALWVGYLDDRPVGTSISLVNDGTIGVYLVSTVPAARGKRVGEAMSWAAATAVPGMPAILQASGMGEPVYLRMGFREIARCPIWGARYPG